ncbi:hypothetical protein ONZ51_g6941 [Trametes cubensis]|uniref:Mid2 domain-containing protein n=1 Tax=Trametes cubensis TaxID=1111947 RepID=A0AAD7TRB4_9APHY|nr:hypothetical protein ONZ51_g6941 [Trametes cubensis]
MSSHTTLVDDSDTDSIQYSDTHSWSAYTGTSLDQVVEGSIHNSTLHVATASGSSITFSFNGISVAVFGSVWPPAATYVPLTTSEYTLFRLNPRTNVSTGSFLAPNLTIPKNNLNFYSSGNIPYDAYVLTINVTQTSIDSPYYLDYIAVEAPGPAPSITSMQATRSSATTGVTSTPSASHGPVLPVGAIIGIAIGSVCAIALALALVVFVCMRRRPPPSEFNYGSVGQRGTSAPPRVLWGATFKAHNTDGVAQDLPSPVIPYVVGATRSQVGCDASFSAFATDLATSPFDASNIARGSIDHLVCVPASMVDPSVRVSGDGANDGHAVDEEPPPAYTPS